MINLPEGEFRKFGYDPSGFRKVFEPSQLLFIIEEDNFFKIFFNIT